MAIASRRRLGHAAALLTIFLWSLTFVQTKVLLDFLSPIEILIDRFVVAWIFFWIVYPKKSQTTLREEWLFLFLGMSGIFGYYLLENIALSKTTATNVGLIVTTAPLFTVVLSLHKKRVTRRYFTGVSLGALMVFGGIFLISYRHLVGFGIGDFLALFGAASFGLYSVLLDQVDARHTAMIVARKSIFYGAAFLILYAVINQVPLHLDDYRNPIVWGNLLSLSLVASGACFVMWSWSVEMIGSTRASNYIYLVPLINTAAAIMILDESLSPKIVTAGALILGGLLVAQKIEDKHRR